MSACETWYSPAAQCYRVEDGGTMYTYYRPEQVIEHFMDTASTRTALIVPVNEGDRRLAQHLLYFCENSSTRYRVALSGNKRGRPDMRISVPRPDAVNVRATAQLSSVRMIEHSARIDGIRAR